jgi:cation diffusion facilitator family transporter
MERHGLVENTREVRRVLLITLLANEGVAALKIVWGYLTGSIGMLSDGFHSLFDGLTNVLGLIAIWVAAHPPDEEHPYGHRKFETLFTVAVAGLILFTCYEVLLHVYRSFTEGHRAEVGAGSFLVMGITIIVNFLVMRYERKRASALGSDFLMADALHTKSNLLSSLGVVAGLLFTLMGYPLADTLAGVVVAGFIAKIGFDILRSAAEVLVDTVRMDTEEVCRVVFSVEGVEGCHHIRTRGSEHHVNLDLHIKLDPEMTLRRAHEITHHVEESLRSEFPQVADIVVHTEPVRQPREEG